MVNYTYTVFNHNLIANSVTFVQKISVSNAVTEAILTLYGIY